LLDFEINSSEFISGETISSKSEGLRIENMENDNTKLKIIYAATLGTIAVVVFIVAITIGADLYLPLKDWLKNVFSHHWVGKSVLSAIIFGVIAFLTMIFSGQASEEKINKALKILIWLVILGSPAIIGFFIWEALLK